jgi:predicted amidophosphoribosyltransferase
MCHDWLRGGYLNKICVSCRQLFKTEDEHVRMCSTCATEFESNRNVCREYLKFHKGASISELSRATDIPIRKIRILIKEGSIGYAD